MAKNKYQDSAMEYSMWYLEHLLKMEDVMGQKLEEKINELLDRKLRDYVRKDDLAAPLETK